MNAKIHRLAALLTAMATLILSAEAGARPKVDVIHLGNGDRITGEIIELQYGQLSVKTDSLGTISIDWLEIATVDSPQGFLVEMNDGTRHRGHIASATADGHFRVAGETDERRLAIKNVAVMSQLEAAFLDRIDGSVSFGFDQSKSSEVTDLAFAFDAAYRSDRNYSSIGGYFYSTRTSDQGTQNQYSLDLTNQFLRPNDNFWLATVGYESNEEQGIDGRLIIGGARGHFWVRNSTSEFGTFAGIALTQEWASAGGQDEQSAEALLGLQWKIFRFGHPKTTLTSQLLVLPSLSDSGRYRGTAAISLDYEIVRDFYLDLSFNGSYDNEPPDATALTTDYSVTTSLEYKF